MTSTKFNVGLGGDSRNSSKVLKPPGGGSSDIFGTTHDPEPQQRKVRNHLTSSIFGGEDGQTPARNKAGNDSFYNLFGAETQSQSRPGTAVKDKFKSNIVLDDVKLEAKKSLAFSEDGCKTEIDSGAESEDRPEMNGVHKTEDVETNVVHKNGLEDEEKKEVSQVTTNGDKAEPVVNGSSSASSAASTPASAPAAAAAAPSAPAASAAASRQRVPPGGFSSGLW